MKVSIIGAGYAGLVTGACLAEKKHEVVCVDVDANKVATINSGVSPIFEAGLDDLLARNVGRNLRATTNLAQAVLETDLTVIAVGTPFDGTNIDLTAVMVAAGEIGRALKAKSTYHVVVVKSTVVPGTTDTYVLPAIEATSGRKAGDGFGVGMNPEFLSEGEAVHDFMYPDRIVLGGIDARSIACLEALYEPFDPAVPRLKSNTRTAEMIKYASNALLATLISFSNEFANMGSALGGIDTVDVMRGVHLSQYFRGRSADDLPRIVSFLRAGCGFGGSCLPKDVRALIAHGRKAGVDMNVLSAVIGVNQSQPGKMVDLIRKHRPDLRGARVAVLGLSFKPETNDVRESPAFPIMRLLLSAGAEVKAFDPVANEDAEKTFPMPVTYCKSLACALDGVEIVIVVTPWKEFNQLPELLRDRQPAVLVVDGRRAFDLHAFARYEGTGL